MLKNIIFLLFLGSSYLFGGDDHDDFSKSDEQPKGEFKNEPEEGEIIEIQPSRLRKGFKRGLVDLREDYRQACEEYLALIQNDIQDEVLKNEILAHIVVFCKNIYLSQFEGIEENQFLKMVFLTAVLLDLHDFNQKANIDLECFWTSVIQVLKNESFIDDQVINNFINFARTYGYVSPQQNTLHDNINACIEWVIAKSKILSNFSYDASSRQIEREHQDTLGYLKTPYFIAILRMRPMGEIVDSIMEYLSDHDSRGYDLSWCTASALLIPSEEIIKALFKLFPEDDLIAYLIYPKNHKYIIVPDHFMYVKNYDFEISVYDFNFLIQVIEMVSGLVQDKQKIINLLRKPDAQGNTLMHAACLHDAPNLVSIIQTIWGIVNDKQVFIQLLKDTGEHGNTFLHVACLQIHKINLADLLKVIFGFLDHDVDALMELLLGQNSAKTPIGNALVKCEQKDVEFFGELYRLVGKDNFLQLLEWRDGNSPLLATFTYCNSFAIEAIFNLIGKAKFMDLINHANSNNFILLHYSHWGKAAINDRNLFIRKLIELIGVDDCVELFAFTVLPNQTPLHYGILVNNTFLFADLLEIAQENPEFKKKLRALMNRMEFNPQTPEMKKALAALLDFLNKEDEGCEQMSDVAPDDGDDDSQGGGGAIKKNSSQTLSSLTQLQNTFPGNGDGARGGFFSSSSR